MAELLELTSREAMITTGKINNDIVNAPASILRAKRQMNFQPRNTKEIKNQTVHHPRLNGQIKCLNKPTVLRKQRQTFYQTPPILTFHRQLKEHLPSY